MIETNTQGDEKPRLPMQGIPQPTRDEVLSLPHVHISQHPVMAHKLTALRAKETQPPEFYRLVKEIGALLAYEATSTLALTPHHHRDAFRANARLSAGGRHWRHTYFARRSGAGRGLPRGHPRCANLAPGPAPRRAYLAGDGVLQPVAASGQPASLLRRRSYAGNRRLGHRRHQYSQTTPHSAPVLRWHYCRPLWPAQAGTNASRYRHLYCRPR